MNSPSQPQFLREAPVLMGILNVSPDSFSDGAKFCDPDAALAQAQSMAAAGATIIDIGAESTRPGAAAIDCQTEWRRLQAVLPRLVTWRRQENYRRSQNCHKEQNAEARQLPKIYLSVDTYKAEIARRSLEMGVDIINDVSAGRSDAAILQVLSQAPWATYILMHNPCAAKAGKPPHASSESVTYRQPVSEVAQELRQLYERARRQVAGNIIIDPGLGFAKDSRCNWQLVANLGEFAANFCAFPKPLKTCPPILIGASNKRFVRAGQEPKHAPPPEPMTPLPSPDYSHVLSANLAVCALAIWGGASIIRCHEVREHYRCLRSVHTAMRHRL